MVKRYYCDYCDRSFKDDTEARKKHLSSLQHARNRSEHYEQFKDPATILKEEKTKIQCKRFMIYGDCAFGNGCKFSHYTPHMIWELERHVFAINQNSFANNNFTLPSPFPSDIINEYFENPADGNSAEKRIRNDWNFPFELQNYQNLPPSLWPITPDTITDSNFGKWGF